MNEEPLVPKDAHGASRLVLVSQISEGSGVWQKQTICIGHPCGVPEEAGYPPDIETVPL